MLDIYKGVGKIVKFCYKIIPENILGLQYTEILEDNSAQCRLCGKSFARKNNCVRHVTTVHMEENQNALSNCAYCGKQFKNDPSLKTHLRVVHSIYSSK